MIECVVVDMALRRPRSAGRECSWLEVCEVYGVDSGIVAGFPVLLVVACGLRGVISVGRHPGC